METIDKLLEELTLEEKACLLSGHKSWHSVSIPRLGIPSIFITDGPHGLRKKKENSKETGLGQTEPSTCFPAASTTGTSWNKELLFKMGETMGKECNHYDVHVILGPAVNIKRNPLCGRSFEYFSEDPHLAGILGAELTKGIESRGVGTSVKHYCCNNNEGNRYFGDSILDLRTLHEIYLKVFEHIIKKGKPQTVMCAYNRINGEYASENEYLLNTVLRDMWGFEGLVMSDWGAVNNRVKGLNSGLDLEMPGDIKYNRTRIVKGVQDGRISLDTLNKSVRRVLEMVYRTIENEQKYTANFENHSLLAREIARDSAVLLKNKDNILPLGKEGSYLVVGEMFTKMRYQGAGSSLIKPTRLVNPIDAFNENKINYLYRKGYNVSSFDIDDNLEKDVLDAALEYDKVLFFGGLSEEAESEGFDRDTMKLPYNQVHLINELVKLGKKVIFIIYGGSPVELDFEDGVDAILNMYLPGQEGGNATYDLVFGDVSPSGRLCETWTYKYEDVPFGNELCKTTNDLYKESIFVGYRYYSTYGVDVRYPFGYGLSYSSFSYNNMKVEQTNDGYKVSVEVTNTGKVEASEVVQVYSRIEESKVLRPLRELKGFTKVNILPGETKVVDVNIPLEDLCIYQDGWKLEQGNYVFEVCKNINEVLLSSNVYIKSLDTIDSDEHIRDLYSSKDKLLGMTDKEFERVIGREIKEPTITRPYNLNTPVAKFETWGGKFFLNMMRFGAKMNYKSKLKAKESDHKETDIKNAYFGMRTMESMSFRSMSFASEGMLSHRMALGLVDISNNRILRGLWKIITPERGVKLPKQK